MTAIAAATRAAHLRLHRHGPFQRIARGPVTETDVAAVLALHLNAWSVAATAPGIVGVTMLFHQTPARFFRLALLRAAIADLAGGTPMLHPPQLPEAQPGDDASALGAAYVWLGSHKGGAVLARQLGTAGFGGAARCLSAGRAHDAHWTRLMRAIEGQPQTQQQSIAQAANLWFAAFDADRVVQRRSRAA